MSESIAEDDTAALVDELDAVHDAYADANERVVDHGEESLKAVAAARDRATTLLDSYEERATGTGDFEGFIEFQERFDDLVEDLDDDLPRREAFADANERFDKRRLSTTDFAAAREALAPTADLEAVLTERESARRKYRETRRRVVNHRDELDERLAELEHLRALGDADLDAPTEELREPIAAYDERVERAFRDFRSEASVREVLRFVATTEQYPLVSFRPPPADLREYAARSEAGTESVSRLLDYAGYSPSKLDHYVENPQELKRNVAVHRSYLDGLDATPLKVGWPPPPAAELWWRARELVAVVGRFAPDGTVAALRTVRALAREERYERLRRAAEARAELGTEQRTRLADGDVAREHERVRAERDRLEAALSAHPGP